MNKEQQIREIENIIKAECRQWLDKMYYAECLGGAIDSAEALYNTGYRKIPEGAVVLTKEELVKMMESGYVYDTTRGNKVNIIQMAREIERKETAKEIMQMLKDGVKYGWTKSLDITYEEIKERYGVEVKE